MDSLKVEYKTKRGICQCCQQSLPTPEISDVREFRFSKENMVDYAPWKEIMEDEDEFNEIAEEFAYETINFFATSIDAKLIIEKSELDRVKQFIKLEAIS